MKVTLQTTLSDIEQLPGIREFPGCLMKCRKETWESICHTPFLSMCGKGMNGYVNRIILGIQRLCDMAEDKKLSVMEYWSKEEVELEPDRKDTELIFFRGNPGAPFVILCPGGGYQTVCGFVEGFPAAAELNQVGYNAFVLTYRVRQKHLLPKPIYDLARAIKYLLDQAEELNIAKAYAVMGFSAGGHLAAEWGTVNYGYRKYGLPAPVAEVLCYPGIDVHTLHGNKTVEEMYQSIETNDGNVDQFCIHKNMDGKYPPTYLWQCIDDDTVSFENFRIMKQKLEEFSIPHETKVYPHGGHGLSQPHEAEADLWMSNVTEFLRKWMPVSNMEE